MPIEIASTELQRTVSGFHFATDGGGDEARYGPVLTERFPNCERFWQQLVTPMTKRIELPAGAPDRIRRRARISEDVWRVSYLNYSLFLQLAAAYDHLAIPVGSSFGDFYTHLGSACDLAEDFLLAVHITACECTGNPVPVLQAMSKEEYLVIAAQWYDKEYPKAYEHYHKKGKNKPVHLPPRSTILEGLFAGDPRAWKAYQKFSNSVRQYRNRIVHNVAIGNVLVCEGHVLVPRKELIGNYGELQDVFNAAEDPERLNSDFVIREAQMADDFCILQQHFNSLWEKPIADLTKLLYEDKNGALMAKYNLHLTQ